MLGEVCRKVSFRAIKGVIWAICLAFVAHISVLAANNDLNAGALFSSGLAIVNVVSIDYGVIEVSGSSNNDITIDPADGTITCTNNTDYTCPATGVRGAFQMAGTPGSTVEISCQRSGDVTNGIDTYRYNQARVHVDGTTHLCSGRQTTIATHVLSGNSQDDTVYVGARLRVRGGSFSLGHYTSTTDPQAVRVLYQ